MDARNESDKQPQLSEADADALLEDKQRKSASGLSWDDVAKDDKKGWRPATEMGEGD